MIGSGISVVLIANELRLVEAALGNFICREFTRIQISGKGITSLSRREQKLWVHFRKQVTKSKIDLIFRESLGLSSHTLCQGRSVSVN